MGNLLLASIGVGTSAVQDTPRFSAPTNKASRLYVPLETSSSVAVVDLLAFKQLDGNLNTSQIDPIPLPAGSVPRSITISKNDRYAYISDRDQNLIYVVDIDANSDTYNQHIANINLNVPTDDVNIQDIAINNQGDRLFVTLGSYRSLGDGYIVAININPDEQPISSFNNLFRWHEQIGIIKVGSGVKAISDTPSDSKMAFTNRANESQGYGVLTITNNDSNAFTMKVNYAGLNLGSTNDYFDVNEAVDVTIVYDEITGTEYGFVVGRNGRNLGSTIPSISDEFAGSNIGIIKNPLGSNPELVAATRPVPGAIATSLTVSGNDRYLYATYPFAASTFIFDIQQIIKTVNDNPSDLKSKPIDDIEPLIDVAAGLQLVETNVVGRTYELGVPDGVTPPLSNSEGLPYGV